MADPVAQLLEEWAARFARGEQPDPRDYLAKAGKRADELSALMDAYLQAAPRRQPDAETVELARAWVRGDSPLAELRSRRGLRRDDIVNAIVDEFSLEPKKRGIVKRYYHELEAGLLDPAGLSGPLLDLLARTFKVGRETVVGWRPRRLAAATAFRADAELVGAPLAAGEPEDDAEVRSLFRSVL